MSANLYLTVGGEVLKPCEMPGAKVAEFLTGLEVAVDVRTDAKNS